jgi:hypothetical protein
MNRFNFDSRAGVRLATCLLGLLIATGCGTGKPATVPATGVVTYEGNPVANASVVFSRNTGNIALGEMAVGKTDANGHFELTTHFGARGSSVGAVPGKYEVTVSKQIPPNGMTEAEYQAKVDEVNKIGETGATAPRDQRPPALVEMLPPRYSAPGKTELSATVEAKETNSFTFTLK